MERLSATERAYIRPSPSSGALGGVAERTREAMLVCEAAGHDVVIVETVGVGQSETAVAGMTDIFVLLQLPNAGDDLQAMKKGIMEHSQLRAAITPAGRGRGKKPAVIGKILAHLERTAPDQHQAELPLGARAPPVQTRLL